MDVALGEILFWFTWVSTYTNGIIIFFCNELPSPAVISIKSESLGCRTQEFAFFKALSVVSVCLQGSYTTVEVHVHSFHFVRRS